MIQFNRDQVLDILFESETQLTAQAYIRKISRYLSIPMGQAKKVLKSLVEEQTLAYQDLYGATYVMENFLKPVRVTHRFFIIPPGMVSQAGPNDIDIRIVPGISFGSGHHPTTRLSLEALDTLTTSPGLDQLPGNQAGDIGTGSGILAIAMCLAGMDKCLAWEIDANAVHEARLNLTANDLTQKITLIEDYMQPGDNPLALICANLRYPTLKQLAGLIRSSVAFDGYLILSGIRSWEKQDLIAHYDDHGFTKTWDRDEKNWSAVVLKKTAE